jgi:hypothetical protein
LVTTPLWSVATPDPIGAIGAAWEAGTAANVSVATANARMVFLIEFLLRHEAVFKCRQHTNSEATARYTRITNGMMSQRAVLKFDRVALSRDQIKYWRTPDERIVRFDVNGMRRNASILLFEFHSPKNRSHSNRLGCCASAT